MAIKRWLLCGLALLCCYARAQITPAAPGKPVLRSQNGKRFFSLGGRAFPLFWANGLTDVRQLDDYQAAGFNTVVVRLPWTVAADGALGPGQLQTQRALAEAAAKRGLWIIFQLPAVPNSAPRTRVNADSPAYQLLWTNWVAGAVAQLGDTPHLLGWMLPDDPRGLSLFDDASFSRWMAANYADVGVLNLQWGQKFASLDEATLATAHNLGATLAQTDDFDDESQTGLPRGGWMQAVARGWAFHPAALAAALYKAESYREVVQFWTKTVREADADAVIFSGRLPDYAQLVALPATVDVSLCDAPPSVAEPDARTHNPQAIDVARRAGRFAAIPTLATNATPGIAATDVPRVLASWCDTALAHGASGLAFASWPDLQRNDFLRATAAASLARLQAEPFSSLWSQAPQATAAVVLTPLAEGQMVQGNLPVEEGETETQPRGLCGFGENLARGEPGNLLFALRWNTAYGPVDFLAPEDLAQANLGRYATLLLPQAYDWPDALTGRLTKYANEGGIVLADLGAGAAQMAGKSTELPPSALSLFGLNNFAQMRRAQENLRLAGSVALLPTWGQLPPGTIVTGKGLTGPAFAGAIAYGSPRAATQVLAATRSAEAGQPAACLTFKPIGAGGAVFAPMRLWQQWLPGSKGWDAFFGDLLGRGAQVVQGGAPTLLPHSENIPSFCEAVNFGNSVALLNHQINPQDANPAAAWSQLQTGVPGSWLWSGAVCAFAPLGQAPAANQSRASPVPGVAGDEAQIVALHTFAAPGAMQICRILPVRARHLTGGPLMAHIVELSPTKATIQLWPNASDFVPQLEGFFVKPGNNAGAKLELFAAPGGYALLPGSKHRVTITTLALPADAPPPEPSPAPKPPPRGRKPEKPEPPVLVEPILPPPLVLEATADDKGKLTIEATGAALRIEIVPLI